MCNYSVLCISDDDDDDDDDDDNDEDDDDDDSWRWKTGWSSNQLQMFGVLTRSLAKLERALILKIFRVKRMVTIGRVYS